MVNKRNKVGLAVARKSIVIKKGKKNNRSKNENTSILNSSIENGISAQIVDNPDDIALQKAVVVEAVKHFYKLADEEPNQELFDDDKIAYLNLGIGKLPMSSRKTYHLNLKHSVLSEDHCILLITQNLKNEGNYEKNIEHYRDLLDKHEVDCINDIMPMHQLKSLYMEYEMQNRLMSQYDMFVVDSSVDGDVRKIFGGIMHKRNKLYATVKMNVTNLKAAFEKALKLGDLTIHPNGDNFSMRIGHMAMEESHLAENIMAAVTGFSEKLQGGFKHVCALRLMTTQGRPVQFYSSQLNSSKEKQPVAKVRKSPKSKAVHGELSTQMDAQVTVSAAGDVMFSQKSRKSGAIARPKRDRKAPERLEMPNQPKYKSSKKKVVKVPPAAVDKKPVKKTAKGVKGKGEAKTTGEPKAKIPRTQKTEKAAGKAEKAKPAKTVKEGKKVAEKDDEIEPEQLKVEKAKPVKPTKESKKVAEKDVEVEQEQLKVEKAKPVKPTKESKKVAEKDAEVEPEQPKITPKERKQKQKENVTPGTSNMAKSKSTSAKMKEAEKIEKEPAKKKVSPKRKNTPSTSTIEAVEKKKVKKTPKAAN